MEKLRKRNLLLTFFAFILVVFSAVSFMIAPNITAKADDEPTDSVASYYAQYGFSETTSYSSRIGGIWDAAYAVMGKTWDSEHNAMKIVMLNENAGISMRHFVIYTSIDMLTAATDIGFDKLSFMVFSDNGAFLDEGRGLRVYSKTVSDIDNASIEDNAEEGILIYGDFGIAAGITQFTVTINISDFLALNEDANYLGIVVNIPNEGVAYFSNLTLSKTVEDEPTEQPTGNNDNKTPVSSDNVSSDVFIKTISALGVFALVGVVVYVISLFFIRKKIR